MNTDNTKNISLEEDFYHWLIGVFVKYTGGYSPFTGERALTATSFANEVVQFLKNNNLVKE